MENSGGPELGTLMAMQLAAPIEIGWGKGNFLKKKDAGKTKRLFASQFFCFIDKNSELSPKENKWFAHE